MNLVNFVYNDQQIEFRPDDENVMVNATQMAKLFGKLPKDFLILESTKNFISACLKKENSPFISVKNEEELVTSTQKSGTFMHRLLALKFAAWLNPDFELWVFYTIDQLLNHHYRNQRKLDLQKLQMENQKEQMRRKVLEKNDPDMIAYLELEQGIKTVSGIKAAASRAEQKQLKLNFSQTNQIN